METTYTRRDAVRLLRCSADLPNRYLAAKAEYAPQETGDERKISFQDLMEIRIWTHLSHCDDRSWNAIGKIAQERAQVLDTTHPLSDQRNLTEMLVMTKVNSVIGPRRNPVPRELGFHQALSRLVDTLEFDGNTPIRWRAGTDMNLALPGADVMIDPEKCDGKPTVAGTRTATSRVMESIKRDGLSTSVIAGQLRISVLQAEVALAYELALTLPAFPATKPGGQWHFSVPGRPETALPRIEALLAGLSIANEEDEDEEEGLACNLCNADGIVITCPDDLCRAQDLCVHGDGMRVCQCRVKDGVVDLPA